MKTTLRELARIAIRGNRLDGTPVHFRMRGKGRNGKRTFTAMLRHLAGREYDTKTYFEVNAFTSRASTRGLGYYDITLCVNPREGVCEGTEELYFNNVFHARNNIIDVEYLAMLARRELLNEL